MPRLHGRESLRRLRVTLAVLAVLTTAALTAWPSAAALECEGLALDGGCLFTITGGDTDDPNDGFAVTNADNVPLWDFVQARDVQAIGYPISQRWLDGPFTLQAFQKVILQWDPGRQRMNYYNTLDVLANWHPEVELPHVPRHQALRADRGVADFAIIIRNHLALLEQNAAIKDRFLSEPDWLNLYGLPIRYEEREVSGNPQGLQLLRAQRTVFVIWNVPAPGTTVGRVNLQNVPDKVKSLSNVIIPDAAKAPVPAEVVAQLPVFTHPTPTPAPTPASPAPLPLPPASDREALIRLYHATDGPNWKNNANWLSAAPLDDWHGVTADGFEQVIELRLYGNGLRGTIPPALGYLGRLRRLTLSANELHGSIPPDLGNGTDLETLELSNNRLQGLIPPELGDLPKLTLLRLHGNRLHGEIPPELGRLADLQELYLGENELHGAIPPQLGNLGNLSRLGLFRNKLGGAIPPEFGRLTNLEELFLSGNQLSGTIPPELGNLGRLRQLGLHDNQLSGPIPPEFGRLASVWEIRLSNNRLTGPIPPELGRMSSLSSISFYANQLQGPIPPELGNLIKLVNLDLNSNQLSGTIPPELGRLTNLIALRLNDNRLHGVIPLELGRLANLQHLGLSANQLGGCIPDGLRHVKHSDLDGLGLPYCAPA